MKDTLKLKTITNKKTGQIFVAIPKKKISSDKLIKIIKNKELKIKLK